MDCTPAHTIVVCDPVNSERYIKIVGSEFVHITRNFTFLNEILSNIKTVLDKMKIRLVLDVNIHKNELYDIIKICEKYHGRFTVVIVTTLNNLDLTDTKLVICGIISKQTPLLYSHCKQIFPHILNFDIYSKIYKPYLWQVTLHDLEIK